jgi:hypothetical protein
MKINGDAPRDRARLARMAEIFARECRPATRSRSTATRASKTSRCFADYVRGLKAGVGDAVFWPQLMFIEQPWHRDVALTPAIGELARAWPDRPPIIIDESDAELTSLPTALGLGYAGTSHKNCKGIFKGVANACLLAQRRAAGLPAMLSGEDLSNVGPVALCRTSRPPACFGVTSIERNGHHYFAGLSRAAARAPFSTGD